MRTLLWTENWWPMGGVVWVMWWGMDSSGPGPGVRGQCWLSITRHWSWTALATRSIQLLLFSDTLHTSEQTIVMKRYRTWFYFQWRILSDMVTFWPAHSPAECSPSAREPASVLQALTDMIRTPSSTASERYWGLFRHSNFYDKWTKKMSWKVDNWLIQLMNDSFL